MRILITGGAGFIGSHIQDKCLQEKHVVAVLDNLSTGTKKNISPNASFYKADVTDDKAVQRVFSLFKPEVVFHLAGQIDVQYSLHNPAKDSSINILGMIHVIHAAKQVKTKTIIYSNSGGAYYGSLPTSHLPTVEHDPLAQPISPYGISKWAAEKYLQCLCDQTHMRWVSLRYSNVYGPRQLGSKESGVVPIFIELLLKNESPIIFGNGSSTRDYIYIDDVVSANMKALQYKKNGIFNISTGTQTSTEELFKIISSLLRSSQKAKHLPPRNEVHKSCLSPKFAEKELSWRAKQTLQSGLQETILWHKKLNKVT